MPNVNLLLLKHLLSLLQNIGRNTSTSRMTVGNLAICMEQNLLSPVEKHTLPVDVLVQVTVKVCSIYQLATAFQTHQRSAIQRHLAPGCLLSTENFSGGAAGKRSPTAATS